MSSTLRGLREMATGQDDFGEQRQVIVSSSPDGVGGPPSCRSLAWSRPGSCAVAAAGANRRGGRAGSAGIGVDQRVHTTIRSPSSAISLSRQIDILMVVAAILVEPGALAAGDALFVALADDFDQAGKTGKARRHLGSEVEQPFIVWYRVQRPAISTGVSAASGEFTATCGMKPVGGCIHRWRSSAAATSASGA
jgi:hypothetical protein